MVRQPDCLGVRPTFRTGPLLAQREGRHDQWTGDGWSTKPLPWRILKGTFAGTPAPSGVPNRWGLAVESIHGLDPHYNAAEWRPTDRTTAHRSIYPTR